jgi:hypothetical protein
MFVTAVAIDKGGYPADQLFLFIIEQPPCSFTMFEVDILCRIKYGIDLFVEGADPGRVIAVQDPGDL